MPELMAAIEKARRRLGLTMDEVARRAGRDPSTYSKAVAGAIRPSARTLKAFTVALEMLAAEQADQAARLNRIGNCQERTAA